jgi:hypothetical protein
MPRHHEQAHGIPRGWLHAFEVTLRAAKICWSLHP